MDTSETYRKMCDCPEVQERWDYEGKIRSDKHDFVHHCEGKHTSSKEIWLPRQDQIQKMVTESHRCNKCLLERIFKFTSSDCGDESMEELWLKFYMHEEHGKIWNGEKWTNK